MELTSYVSTLTQRRVMKEFVDVVGIPKEPIPMSVVEIIKEQTSKVPEKYRKLFIQITTHCYKRVNTESYRVGNRETDDEYWYVESPPPWLSIDYQAINGYYIIPEVWKINEGDTRYHSPTPINFKTHDAYLKAKNSDWDKMRLAAKDWSDRNPPVGEFWPKDWKS